MQTIAAYLIAEHIHDLTRDADAARMAKAVARPNRLRRLSGRGLRRLSGVLADLARWLDPALRRPSYGRE